MRNYIIGSFTTDESYQTINIINDLSDVYQILIDDRIQPKFKKDFTINNIGKHTFKIVFKRKVKYARELFYDCDLDVIDLTNFISDELVTTKSMFNNCVFLENIIFPPTFNTSKVTNMDSMFYDCVTLKKLNIEMFDFKNVVNTSHMFHNCYECEYIKFNNNIDVSNVMDMSHMFTSCHKLKRAVLKNWHTNSLIYINDMFSYCEELELVDLTNFNTDNVVNFNNLFYYCGKLKYIIFPNFNINNSPNQKRILTFTDLKLVDFTNIKVKFYTLMDEINFTAPLKNVKNIKMRLNKDNINLYKHIKNIRYVEN